MGDKLIAHLIAKRAAMPRIGDIRGLGAMVACEFVDPKTGAPDAELTKKVQMAALKRGLSRTIELGGRSLFIEVFPVRPRLVIVGAVEVARTLVRLAKELGFETVVIDGRASFATRERFPDADQLIVGWPDEVADEIRAFLR